MQKSDYCSDVDARDRNLYHNNLFMDGVLSCFTQKIFSSERVQCPMVVKIFTAQCARQIFSLSP